MNKVQKQQDEGFTIIEVVLVLAIAALIMLMVFIALPALQRNQRDSARQNDVSRLQSALTNHKGRNRGQLPQANSGAYNNFFGSSLRINNDAFADPSGENYDAQVIRTGSASQPQEFSADRANHIYFYPGASCDGENVTGNISTNARKVAIVKPLEGGGFHCTEA